MTDWMEKPLAERINDSVIGISILSGITGMVTMLVFVLYDDRNWMGCVLAIVTIVILVFALSYFGDRYAESIREVDE